MTQDNDNERWTQRYLEHTIKDMLSDADMDPDTTVVTGVDYVDGHLHVRAVDQPIVDDRSIAEARAILEAVKQDNGFTEAMHGDARAAVFTEDGQRVVESEDEDGESDGSRPVHDREMAAVVAANWLGKTETDE